MTYEWNYFHVLELKYNIAVSLVLGLNTCYTFKICFVLNSLMVIVPHEEGIERISHFVLKAFYILKYYTLTKINKESIKNNLMIYPSWL